MLNKTITINNVNPVTLTLTIIQMIKNCNNKGLQTEMSQLLRYNRPVSLLIT